MIIIPLICKEVSSQIKKNTSGSDTNRNYKVLTSVEMHLSILVGLSEIYPPIVGLLRSIF